MKTWFGISRWKIFLFIAGAAVLGVSLWFTKYLADDLSQGERNRVALYVRAQEEIAKAGDDLEKDLTFFYDIILQAEDIPVIVTDLNDRPEYGNAFGPERDTTTEFLLDELERIKRDGPDPIVFQSDGYKLYYKESRLLTLLKYFPLFQLLLIGAFVLVGFIGLSAAKKAQQNRVWVGMAKETAHQLGTPISAIVAWIEVLNDSADGDQKEVLNELRNDVSRLEMVADRFSKIGSAPKLEKVNLVDELTKTKDYMSRRAPRRVEFNFPDPVQSGNIEGYVNVHLFHWVLENLIRNALDAMDGEGTISAEIHNEGKFVSIDISDTGKGIPQSQVKKVFEPGFTTKQRGWGLGLSLAKRIIENYHSGKIFVKRSKQGEGTTFSIKLPRRN